MFYRKLSEELEIRLTIPNFAGELYALTDRNRAYLRKWLPWLDHVKGILDTQAFIEKQLQNFADSKALHVTIFYRTEIVGVAGYNSLDHLNGIGYIGYWLGEEYTGRGIMTRVVEDLMQLGREYYDLQKGDIRWASQNSKSRAIPQRLGFQHEGTLRKAERVNDEWFDHEVYGYLLE